MELGAGYAIHLVTFAPQVVAQFIGLPRLHPAQKPV